MRPGGTRTHNPRISNEVTVACATGGIEFSINNARGPISPAGFVVFYTLPQPGFGQTPFRKRVNSRTIRPVLPQRDPRIPHQPHTPLRPRRHPPRPHRERHSHIRPTPHHRRVTAHPSPRTVPTTPAPTPVRLRQPNTLRNTVQPIRRNRFRRPTPRRPQPIGHSVRTVRTRPMNQRHPARAVAVPLLPPRPQNTRHHRAIRPQPGTGQEDPDVKHAAHPSTPPE
jgi:hypothetical protein